MQSVTETDIARDTALERLTWARNATQTFLAYVDDQIFSLVTGGQQELPDRYAKLFASGSEPSDDPKDYPSRQELKDAMRNARRRVIAWVESLDAESARQPTP